jgi:hypothetical protein
MFRLDTPWENETDALDHKLGKIAQAADPKSKKSHSPMFQTCPQNWLLIYDDYFRFTSRDSVSYFTAMLPQSLQRSSHEFGRVYAFCDQFVFRWCQRKKLSFKCEEPAS